MNRAGIRMTCVFARELNKARFMTAHRFLSLLAAGTLSVSLCNPVRAGDPPPPAITNVNASGQQLNLQFTFYPGAQNYTILSAPDLNSPFLPDPNFLLTARYLTNTFTSVVNGSNVVTTNIQAFYEWRRTINTTPDGFYRVEVVPMEVNGSPQSTNSLLPGTVLNRLAYGPTPDELARVRTIGADNYVQEQIAPELVSDSLPFENLTTNFGSGWQQFTATGTANTSGTGTNFYLYLNTPGDCFIDDIRLVAGSTAGVGVNLIRNGDFESALNTSDWIVSANHAASAITTAASHSGSASLHMVASVGGTTQGSAIWQPVVGLTNGARYTLSYWFLPSLNNQLSSLTTRFSGSWIASAPYPVSAYTKLVTGAADIDDLRNWHVQRGVQSRRQLLEVLDQFLENHFVTQYSKSSDYFDTYYDGNIQGLLATQLEFKENLRWRQALMNPQCTFYDLLRISAESPAMIIYLDTVNSRGDGGRIANENYARELLELFAFGVDNGYDQNDITVMSRAWTGWSVNIMNPTNEFNPLATDLRTLNPGVAVSNLVGVWSFQYKQANHNTASKTIFPGKTVPARFGPPYAGRNYQLALPVRTGTNGIADGYDVLRHLADQPFTQEYLCVKLCRLFIHDDFDHGVYDYTDPNLSPEGQLIKQCMAAWENGSPKGQIRDVLRVIFASDLFRNHSGSMQKVKTPLEYIISAVRALRTTNTNGTYTADVDPARASIGDPLNRMGTMLLFDRAEPNGYPEAGAPWISAGTLAERLRYIQAFLIASGQSGRGDAGNSLANPVALLQLELPSASWKDAGAVADLFLDLLFPGEGTANLAVYRTAAINFLNTADLATVSSPFSALTVSSVAASTYDTRVRGMVSMLMTSPRFQEQ
jgi:uncharacterized protein (DUF1800 family)